MTWKQQQSCLVARIRVMTNVWFRRNKWTTINLIVLSNLCDPKTLFMCFHSMWIFFLSSFFVIHFQSKTPKRIGLGTSRLNVLHSPAHPYQMRGQSSFFRWNSHDYFMCIVQCRLARDSNPSNEKENRSWKVTEKENHFRSECFVTCIWSSSHLEYTNSFSTHIHSFAAILSLFTPDKAHFFRPYGKDDAI